MASTNKSTSKTRTRREILNRLKLDGPSDSAQLAAQLGVGAMAVRQHLYALQEQGLVTFQEEARALGRPAKLWQLTPAANDRFPENHAELTLDLIRAVTNAFGSDGMDKLLEVRMQDQVARYRAQIGAVKSLKARLKALAQLRTAEGYMAEVKPDAETSGAFLLIENHCPICAAAKACAGLCQREMETFQAILGEDVQIERTEYILAGARRCMYRVKSEAQR